MYRLLRMAWCRLWLALAGTGPVGRMAAWLASWPVGPLYRRSYLSDLSRAGYVAPSARIHHRSCQRGGHVLLDDRVLVFQDTDGGPVILGERVRICRDTVLQTGAGGRIEIGANTFIQPRCQLSAYKGSIRIGGDVQIAPGCAFYPYNHATVADRLISKQPLTSKGDIVVGDGAWLGFGVVVLDGVRIGEGAVIGAGSVVTRSVPAMAVAAGNPARLVDRRPAAPAEGLAQIAGCGTGDVA